MKILLVFVLFFIEIFGANLLSYNVYERDDRVDVMLSFDAPYEGNIFQKRDKNRTSLVLNSLNFTQTINQKINSNIVQSLQITPRQSSLVIDLNSAEPILLNASKTSDGFGLRIRVGLKNTPEQMANMPKASVKLGQNETVNSDESLVDSRYFIVLGALLTLLLLLYMIKKYISSQKQQNASSSGAFSWLIKGSEGKINVLQERYLDRQNKVVLLDYNNQKYLVLTGASNVLLDRFGEDKIQNEEDFAVFFEENKKRLGNYLQDRQSSLDNYKNKLTNA
ncbi:hypothetical protein [Campylobacter majalis]|uniref:hypothetical protein n=1 Tax=Campylobacter majalis TaxID=2790656 RepID=UPI003D69319D